MDRNGRFIADFVGRTSKYAKEIRKIFLLLCKCSFLEIFCVNLIIVRRSALQKKCRFFFVLKKIPHKSCFSCENRFLRRYIAHIKCSLQRNPSAFELRSRQRIFLRGKLILAFFVQGPHRPNVYKYICKCISRLKSLE